MTSPSEFIYRQSKEEQCAERGYSAYRNGEHVENNPYYQEDYKAAWERGWYQGQWEDENE